MSKLDLGEIKEQNNFEKENNIKVPTENTSSMNKIEEFFQMQSQLKDYITECQGKVNSLEDENANLQAENEKLSNSINNLNEQLSEKEAEMQNLFNKLQECSSTEELENKLQILKEQNIALSSENTTIKEKLNDISSLINTILKK